MQNNLRGSYRPQRNALSEEEASSPSYFEWREQTVRMPAVSPVPRGAQPNAIVRLIRRITRK